MVVNHPWIRSMFPAESVALGGWAPSIRMVKQGKHPSNNPPIKYPPHKSSLTKQLMKTHWFPLIKAWLNPYFPRGGYVGAGYRFHSSYSNPTVARCWMRNITWPLLIVPRHKKDVLVPCSTEQSSLKCCFGCCLIWWGYDFTSYTLSLWSNQPGFHGSCHSWVFEIRSTVEPYTRCKIPLESVFCLLLLF